MCAKSCNLATAVSQTGEFLHELEEKMEVCVVEKVTKGAKMGCGKLSRGGGGTTCFEVV